MQQENHPKQNSIRRIFAGAKEMFFLPPTIELTNNTHATVQGSRGILEYTDEQIRIRLAEAEACFFGTELSICSLDQDSLEIRGRIERVEYR